MKTIASNALDLFQAVRFPSVRVWIALSSLIFAIVAWDERHGMNSDGLSYLDIASASLDRGVSNLVNLYWSPLYPALIAATFWLFQPSPEMEFPAVHVLNWLISIGTLFSFTFFVTEWLKLEGHWPPDGQASPMAGALVSFAFSLCVWSTLRLITVSIVTPDLLIATCVFLAAGLCCRLSRERPRYVDSLLLGSVLAISYYGKAAMFPISLALFAALSLSRTVPSPRPARVGVAVMMFLILTSPWIIIQTKQAGRFTIGEAGRLNYVWYVNGITPFAGWVGGPDSAGAPRHPPRILLEKPLLLEFRDSGLEVYPLWYNPAYWYEGVQARIDFRQQMVHLMNQLRWLGNVLVDDMGSLCAGFGVLLLVLARNAGVCEHPRPQRQWWMVVWPLVSVGMYLLVHLENRFIGAFVVLFWLFFYSSLYNYAGLSHHRDPHVFKVVLATVTVAIMISAVSILPAGAIRTMMVVLGRAHPPEHVTVAKRVGDLGLNRGDRIATVGYSFDSYYARTAGLRIVAQVPDEWSLRGLSAAELGQLLTQLQQLRVKALVTRRKDIGLEGESLPDRSGWRLVWRSSSESYFVRLVE